MNLMDRSIVIQGATEHNLKNFNLEIPRQSITVITGVSGSGKSSLAFDTILTEAQRRFFYTLSHYSRQFLDLGSRPAVRYIGGLSPAIALAQNETQASKRASVGTLTDISELVGVIFARFSQGLCPKHGLPTGQRSMDDLLADIQKNYQEITLVICAPIAEAKKGHFSRQLAGFVNKGYLKAYIDGKTVNLMPEPVLNREEKHTIKLIVDYIKVKPAATDRLKRALETALLEGNGLGEFYVVTKAGELEIKSGGLFSLDSGCPTCGYSWPKMDSRYFSSNSLGKCETCQGLGVLGQQEDDAEGDDSEVMVTSCPDCGGTGLSPKYDSIQWQGYSARQIHGMTIVQLAEVLRESLGTQLQNNPAFVRVCEETLKICQRVIDVGLSYLQVSRRIRSLSGGEAQRLKLAGILAESLRGVLYVLDEPSQGLHQSELQLIWKSLERLRSQGSTVLIVDHDEFFMRHADWIVDLGPGGGADGGQLMAKFKPEQAKEFANISLTAKYLSKVHESRPVSKKTTFKDSLVLQGASLHNLNIKNAQFKIGGLNCVTGVSGAGKSSLVLGTLAPNLSKILNGKNPSRSKKPSWQDCLQIQGWEAFDQVILIDRKPVAKSSVSSPATYLDVFGLVRKLYEKLPDAQIAGLGARAFSLNVEGGRCEECKGRGVVTLSMRFLADARVVCPICNGRRFKPFVDNILYNGLSISDVLDLTLQQAAEHFKHHRQILRRLEPACKLGLGYLSLGQTSSSLSGGEAQRLKLVPFFARQTFEKKLFIMDEPTQGLHFADVERLIAVLREIVAMGATVIAVEHNPDVIWAADWVLDIGPGSALEGGKLVAEGHPSDIVKRSESVTAKYLNEVQLANIL
jgi:excinuclease ABC subunit A